MEYKYFKSHNYYIWKGDRCQVTFQFDNGVTFSIMVPDWRIDDDINEIDQLAEKYAHRKNIGYVYFSEIELRDDVASERFEREHDGEIEMKCRKVYSDEEIFEL